MYGIRNELYKNIYIFLVKIQKITGDNDRLLLAG